MAYSTEQSLSRAKGLVCDKCINTTWMESEITLYDTDTVRILYLYIYPFTIQYNWRQTPDTVHTPEDDPSYHICEIIFWRRTSIHRNKVRTINLHEYNALLKDTPHLQNPRWDSTRDTKLVFPPFEGDWKRYNPFKAARTRA